MKKTIAIGIFISTLLTCIVGNVLYQKKVKGWKPEARQTLSEVLHREVIKRSENDTMPLYHTKASSRRYTFPVRYHEISPTVSVRTEHGTIYYELTAEKDSCNITYIPQERIFCSRWFQAHPLNIDTVQRAWNESLRKAGISGEGFVHIKVKSPLTGLTTTQGDSLQWAKAEKVAYSTIGYACEIEVTGYAIFPLWKFYTGSAGGWLLLLWIAIFAVTWWVCNKRMITSETGTGIKQAELSKECPQAHLYPLKDGIVYNKPHRALQKSNQTIKKLSTQNALLLEALLEAAVNTPVSNEELKIKLWPDGSGNDTRLHQAVRRMNNLLAEVSTCSIRNNHGAYYIEL